MFTITARFEDGNQPSVIETAPTLGEANRAAVRLRRQLAALKSITVKNNRRGEADVYYPVPERANEAQVADGFQFYGLRLAFIIPNMR